MSAQGLWETGLLNCRIQKTENGRIRKGHLRKPRMTPHGCIATPGGEHRNRPACAEASAGRESGRMCPATPACAGHGRQVSHRRQGGNDKTPWGRS